jgi:hypothetical protein
VILSQFTETFFIMVARSVAFAETIAARMQSAETMDERAMDLSPS